MTDEFELPAKDNIVQENKYNWEMITEDKKEGDHGPDGHVVRYSDKKNWTGIAGG